jgi:hypothetical protein
MDPPGQASTPPAPRRARQGREHRERRHARRQPAEQWAFSHFPLGGARPGLAEWLRTAGIFLVGSNVVTNVPFILIVLLRF